MHSVCSHLQVCFGGHVHQLVEVHVQLQLDLLLVLALGSVLNGLDCVHEHNGIHAVEALTCDQQHYSPYQLCVS